MEEIKRLGKLDLGFFLKVAELAEGGNFLPNFRENIGEGVIAV